jgi:hypothetical protein
MTFARPRDLANDGGNLGGRGSRMVRGAGVRYTGGAFLGPAVARNINPRTRNGDGALWKKEGPAHDRLFR